MKHRVCGFLRSRNAHICYGKLRLRAARTLFEWQNLHKSSPNWPGPWPFSTRGKRNSGSGTKSWRVGLHFKKSVHAWRIQQIKLLLSSLTTPCWWSRKWNFRFMLRRCQFVPAHALKSFFRVPRNNCQFRCQRIYWESCGVLVWKSVSLIIRQTHTISISLDATKDFAMIGRLKD